MDSSNKTVFPLPVGADITMFISDKKQPVKHSLCRELKYLSKKRKKKGNSQTIRKASTLAHIKYSSEVR